MTAVYVSYRAQATAAVVASVAPLVEAMAITTADEVKELIRTSKPTGRLYRLPGTRGRGRARKRRKSDPYGPLPASNTYQASAPGEAPAEREALYRESWTYTPPVVVGDQVVATAYTARPTPDGKHLLGDLLENGTRKKVGAMKPRPHAGPAMRTVQPKLRRLVAAYGGSAA